MTVGIVALGLIGGSMAKAYRREAGTRVLACDIDRVILDFARVSDVIDDELTLDNAAECDLLLLCAYPQASEDYLRAAAPHLRKDALVVDCLGTKRAICRTGFALAEQYGFTFVGGHPMAGSHNSGFKYSRANLFERAPMVLVPPRFDDIELLERVKTALAPVGFGSFTVTTAEKHDKMIAFTSQLPHIVSNAFVKSPTPTSKAHKGFSAGSYKDMTRVAWLSPGMWTELFLENRDNLLGELDTLIASLSAYREALAGEDGETLYRLLDEGRARKKEIDQR